jgi:hypothetical protein
MKRTALPLLMLGAALTICANERVAHADDASLIFDRAVKEHDAGKCEQDPIGDPPTCARAADDFAVVFQMNPQALGALRNLAYTERGLGRIASAARHFRELAEKAPSDSKPERRAWATFAAQEATSLSERVPKLTLQSAAPTPNEIVARVDDKVVTAIGTPMDLDPGQHTVHVEAAGFQPFDALVQLQERDQKNVEIKMTPNAQHPGIAILAPPHTPPAPTSPPPAPGEHHSTVAPTVIAIAGAGVAAIGLGLGLGALVERNSNCDTQKLCDGNSLQTAHGLADASTVVVIVGGAALAVGIVWYIAVPSSSGEPAKVTASISATPRSVSAIVRF